ncbi:hypothetical protein FRB99_006614 [Tulasnella sp. 403]|nr:hypothetical protein FRB99_006614 [Tulasnella sp. 403]
MTHPHTKLELPVIRSISLNPILYTQPPSYDALHTKLSSFIDAATGISNKASLKLQISDEILPFMKTCFPSSTSKLVKSPHSQTDSAHAALLHVTQSLIGSLPPSELFPLVDLWRIAVLDERIAASLSLAKNLADAPGLIFRQVQSSQDQSSGLPRNLLLTVLRFTSNCFAVPSLARHVLNPSSDTTRSESPRSTVTSILIPALLHEDSAVRTAAASTVFNVATYIQKPLMDYQRNGAKGSVPFDSNEDGEWIVEIVSALIEGLKTEKGNQDVETLVPLLEVLQAKDVLAGKLEPGGCGPEGVRSEELRKLIQETIDMYFTDMD